MRKKAEAKSEIFPNAEAKSSKLKLIRYFSDEKADGAEEKTAFFEKAETKSIEKEVFR